MLQWKSWRMPTPASDDAGSRTATRWSVWNFNFCVAGHTWRMTSILLSKVVEPAYLPSMVCAVNHFSSALPTFGVMRQSFPVWSMWKVISSSFHIASLISSKFEMLFITDFIYLFLGRGEGRERGRETSMCACLLCAPYWGSGLPPRHVPWLGIKPVTLWFAGQCAIYWATPARDRDVLILLMIIQVFTSGTGVLILFPLEQRASVRCHGLKWRNAANMC